MFLHKKDSKEITKQKEDAKVNKLISTIIIINHKSAFYRLLNTIDIICSIFSAHFYIWIATFGMDNNTYELVAQIVVELFFLFSMATKFLTDYVPPGEIEAEKNLSVIASRYFHNGFIWDFVPLLPINAVFSGLNGEDK